MCHDKTQTDTAEILELDTAIAIYSYIAKHNYSLACFLLLKAQVMLMSCDYCEIEQLQKSTAEVNLYIHNISGGKVVSDDRFFCLFLPFIRH